MPDSATFCLRKVILSDGSKAEVPVTAHAVCRSTYRVQAENFQHRALIGQRQGPCGPCGVGRILLCLMEVVGPLSLGRKRLFGVIVLSFYVEASKKGKTPKTSFSIFLLEDPGQFLPSAFFWCLT